MKSKDAGVKLAVEFDYIKKGNPAVNMIVSGFSQATRTIEEKIRGGFIRRWNESGSRPSLHSSTLTSHATWKPNFHASLSSGDYHRSSHD